MAKTGRKGFGNAEGLTLKTAAQGLLTKPSKNAAPQPKKQAKMNLKLEKKHGQHLLKNPGIVKKILEAADIKKSDTVLEIGPGTGNLTMSLLSMARKVRAVDIDVNMTVEVKKRALARGFTNLEILLGDALKTDFGAFTVCTANLPYQISSPFVFKLISIPQTYRCAVLMFQLEFGERLIAKPHDKMYGRLSVNTQLFFKATRVCNVSAKSFNPPPKVESVVIKLVPHHNKWSIANYAQWDGMLRIAFGRKRRTLAAAFTSGKIAGVLCDLYTSNTGRVLDKAEFRAHIRQLLADLPFNDGVSYGEKRAIELGIPDFITLLNTFMKNGILFPASSTSRMNVHETFQGDALELAACFLEGNEEEEDVDEGEDEAGPH